MYAKTRFRFLPVSSLSIFNFTSKSIPADGGFLEAVFCDVFEMENAKIKRLTTYQVNLKADSKEQISRGRGKPRVVVKA